MFDIDKINPNLLIIAFIVLFVGGIVLLLYYIPRSDELVKLRRENKGLKQKYNNVVNELCVELIKSGKSEEDVKRIVDKEQAKTRQANKRSKTFAATCDKLRGIS